jgi:hypothetical protein
MAESTYQPHLSIANLKYLTSTWGCERKSEQAHDYTENVGLTFIQNNNNIQTLQRHDGRTRARARTHTHARTHAHAHTHTHTHTHTH